MLYQGIELTMPKGRVSLSHSTSLDLILGASTTQNMDWLEVLGDFPWSLLKEEYYQGYDNQNIMLLALQKRPKRRFMILKN